MLPLAALNVTLNANQRRHFEVLFSGLERTLSVLEEAASASATATDHASEPSKPAGSFTVVVSDLPPGFSTAASPILKDVRQRLHELRSALSLVPRPVSQRHTCRALVTSEIIRIEESYARGLRGYGPVDPSVAESLDPVLRELREALGDIASLLSKKS